MKNIFTLIFTLFVTGLFAQPLGLIDGSISATGGVVKVEFTANAGLPAGVGLNPMNIWLKIPGEMDPGDFTLTSNPFNFLFASEFANGGSYYINYQSVTEVPLATFPMGVAVNMLEFTVPAGVTEVALSGGDFGMMGSGSNWPGSAVVQGTDNLTLPVELTSFQVNKKGDQNALVTWQTASEVNTSHFDIERSLDNGKSWEKVGMQSAQGFSTNLNNYEFEDKNLKRFIDQNQLVYYRLKSVDYDLSHQLSQTKNISIEIETVSIAIYPNPTVEGVNITVHSKDKRNELTAILKDLTGRTVFARNLGNSKMINEYVNFANLASGTYFMTVQSDDRVFSTEKLVILEK